ncbi:heme ABC transporter ATP-binding protein [Herbiconiux sp. L3-i23]|uniref:heme ABC transporter ATP-binding protein n=1 Tax=Herbiconiux sp. L3-i23 TaxID=2905871 RepID=UPI0020733B82|nr:heme ABC transporter ATP-binding protein [Herbiconiux sp. L3-i23]
MTAAVVASDIVVSIGGRRILDGVSVEVPAGRVHALLGPNGAGKSTLLAALSGDLPAESGRVEIVGRSIAQWRVRELARERAVLTQDHAVSFSFPVSDVVTMGRAPWVRTPREEDDERAVDAAIAAVELDHLRDRAVPTLSGGERARTAIARVLAQEAGILLLDEPTAALDLRHQEQTMRLARRVASGGGTVIVVVHDLTLAAAYADRVTLLAEGRVAAEGTLDEIGADLLGAVYDQPVEFIRHPSSGSVIVQPIRPRLEDQP